MYNKFYHLSDNNTLEGIWKPRIPKIVKSENTSKKVDNFARICVSPTIHNCFQSIYRNIANRFIENKKDTLRFFVYSPELSGDEKILDSKYLTKNKLVEDAHVTLEHCILNPVKMLLVSEIEINNTSKLNCSDTYYHPFNESNFPKIYLAPSITDFKVINDFKNISVEATPIFSKW